MTKKQVVFSVAACAAAVASAGQIRTFRTPEVGYAETAPVLDGAFREWRSEAFSRIKSVSLSEHTLVGVAEESKTTFPFQETTSAVALRYDAENLYVAIDWDDASPAQKGDSVTLHLRGDVEGSVRFVPTVDGKGLVASILREGRWLATDAVAAISAVREDGSGWGIEAAVPWRALTGEAEIPSGAVMAVWQFTWSGLDREELGRLGIEERVGSCHTTMNAVSAEPQFRRNAHLPHPSDWGRIHFGKGKEACEQAFETLITDATDIGCPRAAGVKMDGDLSDWKDAAWVDFEQLGDLPDNPFGGRVATSFDEEALYVAVFMRHATGKPVNVKPLSTAAGFGGGDAFQMRLADGKGFSASTCAWWDSQAESHALTVDGLARGWQNLLEHGAELAFGTAPGGYTMEFKLPWKAILLPGVTPPKAGDVWRTTFQPWWQIGSPAFNFITDLTFSRSRAVMTVPYEMPRDGFVSLGLFDRDGRLLVQLLKNEYRTKGAQAEPWNGKDQYGELVAPGSYTVKAVVMDELKADYAFTLGNPGTPSWPTADGTGDWLSDEAPPQAIVTDGENVYVAAPGNEKGFGVMKLDAQGRKQWGANEPFYPRVVSLSYCDGKLYALYSGPEITNGDRYGKVSNSIGRAVLIVYDARTGQKIDFSLRDPRLRVATWPCREETTPLWEMIQNKSFSPSRYIGQPRYWNVDVGETCNAIGVAATKTRVAISRFYDDRLEFFDPRSAKKIGQLALEKPAGLYAEADGSILAISGKRVVRVSPDNRVTPVVTGGLSAPVAVTRDSQGFIYVSDWAEAMQVKKFDAKGKLVARIGQDGGRGWVGTWNPKGMLLPHGLAVTDKGVLWVAEADMTPKRISAWNAGDGKLIKDWLGPISYGGCSALWYDPKEPSILHFEGGAYEVDWKTGAAKLLRTELRRMSMGALFTPKMANTIFDTIKRVSHDGKEYLVFSYTKMTYVVRVEGEKFIPCAAIGCLHRPMTDDGTGVCTWDSDVKYHMFRNMRPEVFRGHKGDNYSWSDANGDGEVQPNEMTFVPTVTRGGTAKPGEQYEIHINGSGCVDSKGALFYGGFGRTEDVLYKLEPSRWSAYGPVYDIKQAKPFHTVNLAKLKWSCHNNNVYVDSADNLFVPTAFSTAAAKARESFRDTIYSLDPNGKVRWSMAAPPDSGRNSYGATAIIGEWKFKGIGSVLASWHWWWNFRPYFITSDGLYIGTVFEETKLGPAALWGESRNFCFQAPDGTAYLINAANQSLHVFRIKGLENATRFVGSVTVTAETLDKARRLAQVKMKASAPKAEITVRAFAADESVVDGDLAEWREAAFVSLDGGKGRAARLALGRCGDRLLLAADVTDPTPMRQVGSDYRCLFTTGDVVDLMLGTDPKAIEKRTAAAIGDLRLSVTELAGKPVVVLTEPKVKDFAGTPQQLMAARIDRIRILESAQAKIVRRKGGYVVEASVPLAELGLDARASNTLRGDLGVVFSDAVGGRELRLYHYNKKTEMVMDLTTEATLQPAEWGAIHFPLGVNLLKDGSFEGTLQKKGGASGWQVDYRANGANAKFDTKAAFDGRKSLLIWQGTPVTFSEEAMNDPDYKAFRNAANGGKGAGHVSVRQSIPVVGGHKYQVRWRWRAENLKQEVRGRGPERGYASARLFVFFVDASGRTIATRCPSHVTANKAAWQEGSSVSEHDVSGLIEAPAKAVRAIVSVKFTCLAPNILPKLWFDDFEFVERL